MLYLYKMLRQKNITKLSNTDCNLYSIISTREFTNDIPDEQENDLGRKDHSIMATNLQGFIEKLLLV